MKRCIVILGSVAVILVLILFYLLLAGASFYDYCFAVDSNDRCYVGRNNSICVFEQNSIVSEINCRFAGRGGYLFTIKDDEILLSSVSKGNYVLDLQGNVLSSGGAAKTADCPKQNNSSFLTNNTRYERKTVLGYWTIENTKTGEVVAHLPLIDYVLRIVVIPTVTIIITLVVLVILRYRRRDHA